MPLGKEILYSLSCAGVLVHKFLASLRNLGVPEIRVNH